MKRPRPFSYVTNLSPAACVLLLVGCTAPSARPEASQTTPVTSYAMEFPEPAKSVPTHPWENGYIPPAEREVRLATGWVRSADFGHYAAGHGDCVVIRRKAPEPESTFAAEMAWTMVKTTADLGYQAAKNEIKKAAR